MKEEKPLILISNDDGVTSKGIEVLIKTLSTIADIVVMAPDSPRSGSACAITAHGPIHYKEVYKNEGITVYRCSGTPVDCIKLALEVLDKTPDMIVSGINHGSNASVNVHYSGTMGVVIEGCLKNIPSVGFSLCNHDADADFTATIPYILDIVQKVLNNGLPPHICLNVNFPKESPYKGLIVSHQCEGEWTKEWEEIKHRGTEKYYWLTGEFVDKSSEGDEADHRLLEDGFVTVTPVHIDMTAYTFMDELKSWWK